LRRICPVLEVVLDIALVLSCGSDDDADGSYAASRAGEPENEVIAGGN
jgi:hypothetical protein